MNRRGFLRTTVAAAAAIIGATMAGKVEAEGPIPDVEAMPGNVTATPAFTLTASPIGGSATLADTLADGAFAVRDRSGGVQISGLAITAPAGYTGIPYTYVTGPDPLTIPAMAHDAATLAALPAYDHSLTLSGPFTGPFSVTNMTLVRRDAARLAALAGNGDTP